MGLDRLLGPGGRVRLERLLALSRPLRLNRAMTLIALATTLAVAGAGTATAATAATASPVTTRHLAAAGAVKDTPRDSEHKAAKHKAAKHRAARHHHRRYSLSTWRGITHAVAGKPSGWLPARDRLLPAGTSGPQAFMTMTSSRYANATTIVKQALKKHMGLRSAVIAVATAMQESTLENISYGDRDSLGLFQQRPSMGWGSPSEVTNPVYASDAFLNALRQYQARHGAWATQPLWEAAQGVQNSGFPYAYAKWEDQAAHVVATVARRLY